MNRSVRRDEVHKGIVKFLRDCFVSVFDAAKVGQGFPDLIIGVHGKTYLVELKTREASVKKGRLRENQQKFADGWRGSKVMIWRSIQDAADFLNATK